MTYFAVCIVSPLIGAVFGFLCCAMLTVAKRADETVTDRISEDRA